MKTQTLFKESKAFMAFLKVVSTWCQFLRAAYFRSNPFECIFQNASLLPEAVSHIYHTTKFCNVKRKK